MDRIRTHIKNLTVIFNEAAQAANAELPALRAPIADLIADVAYRQHHRDILLDMFLPMGKSDEARAQVVQTLDDQAARSQLRIHRRNARRRRREAACR